MPNGGVLASCFVCKYAKKDMSRPTHPVTNNPLMEPIDCQRNGFLVWLPSMHVCAGLGDSAEGGGLSKFAENAKLESGSVYAWLEFGYRTKAAPHLPQYHHELVKVASFQDYAAWTLEQKESAYARARNQKELERLRQSKN